MAALESTQIISQPHLSDSIPPLVRRDRAAIELANSERTAYLLCDEFNNLTLIWLERESMVSATA